MRVENIMRPDDGGGVFLGIMRDVAELKSKWSVFNRGIADRPLRSASGEIFGTRCSRRSVRSPADERSRGNAGKEIPYKLRTRRRGADPAKNVLGRTGFGAFQEQSEGGSSSGKDSWIIWDSFSDSECFGPSSISQTRSCCWSTSAILSLSSGDRLPEGYCTMMGKAGQRSRVISMGSLSVQRSRRSSRCCEENIMVRHRRHT